MARKTKEEAARNLAVEVSPTDKIQLPSGMDVRSAVKALIEIDKQDEMDVRIHHEFECYPFEGAYALQRALKARYGWTNNVPTPGFFGPQPPRMVGVDVSLTEHVQVPWGRITVPNISGFLETSGAFKPEGKYVFSLSGVVKQRDKGKVNDLVDLIRYYIEVEGLYKGRAIMVEFPEDPYDADFTYLPKFIDTGKYTKEDLILPDAIQRKMNVSLFGPVEFANEFRAQGIPLKRGVLLNGKYGVGKTLASTILAGLCEKNGWSFLLLQRTKDLKYAIEMARAYAPCVVFAEDIDRAMDDGRTEDIDAILNTIDGVESKNTEVMVVLTTNHIDRINPAMLRPGRLDDIILIPAPDASAAERLVRKYSNGLLESGADLTEAASKMEGWIPAFIQETVQRAKRAEVMRAAATGETAVLTVDALIDEIASMRAQLKYMNQDAPVKLSEMEKAALIQGTTIANGLKALAATIGEVVGVQVEAMEHFSDIEKELPVTVGTN